MSWFSQFFHDVVDGFVGKPPSQLPTSGTPIHNALVAVDTAANQAAQTTASAAKTAVDDFLQTKVGPVGATMIDNSLRALIEEAESRLSTSPVGQQNSANTAVPLAA